MMIRTALVVLTAVSLLTSSALADSRFDGSEPLLCAVAETFECQSGKECKRGRAPDIALPDFLKIDFRKKRILSSDEDGKGTVTKISGMQRVENLLLLHGVDAYHTWSIVIGPTGRMSLTLAAHKVGFVVFGACVGTKRR